MTQDRYIIADASSVTGAEFFAHVAPLFGRTKPGPKQAELREAEQERQDAIQAAYRLPKLWDSIEAKAAANAAYAAKVEAIEAKYALAPVERISATAVAA